MAVRLISYCKSDSGPLGLVYIVLTLIISLYSAIIFPFECPIHTSERKHFFLSSLQQNLFQSWPKFPARSCSWYANEETQNTQLGNKKFSKQWTIKSTKNDTALFMRKKIWLPKETLPYKFIILIYRINYTKSGVRVYGKVSIN